MAGAAMISEQRRDGSAAADPSPRTPKLRIEGLAKSYNAVPALKPTSLQMAPGEFLTLLGPSGSGKTTLLSMVAGLTAPDSGEIWIDDRPATHLPSFKRDIGMVFQNYALFPHLTVFENIAFPLEMRRRPRAEIAREVTRVLEVVALPHTADRLPHELSGGQQQRIALARCMVYRPSIILMDEPLGALDKKLREQIQIEIKHLHIQFGITILYVTHDQQEALAMSDRICLINRAEVEQIGTPTELYFSPASEFVADFLGESNILEGVATNRGGGIEIAAVAGATVRARASMPVGDGARIRWMVRPEDVAVIDGPVSADRNILRGVLSDVIFAGDVTKLLVRLADGSILIAKQLTRRRGGIPALGAEIGLGWQPEDTVVLPEPAPR